MSQIRIRIEAFGAVERQLPQNLEIICKSQSTVSEVFESGGTRLS